MAFQSMIKIDLTWNDSDVLPDKLRPDVEFLFFQDESGNYSDG